MADVNSIVAVYETHAEAEAGVCELQKAGFDVTRLSVVGKETDADEHIVGCYNCAGRMKYWGRMGEFWGGLWEYLVGAGFFVVPGIGPVLVAGPLTEAIVATLDVPVLVRGFSPLGAGLYVAGVPRADIFRYEWSLQVDKLLVVVQGAAGELMRAKDYLRGSHPEELNLHFGHTAVMAHH